MAGGKPNQILPIIQKLTVESFGVVEQEDAAIAGFQLGFCTPGMMSPIGGRNFGIAPLGADALTARQSMPASKDQPCKAQVGTLAHSQPRTVTGLGRLLSIIFRNPNPQRTAQHLTSRGPTPFSQVNL
jgi:hypothetical protein